MSIRYPTARERERQEIEKRAIAEHQCTFCGQPHETFSEQVEHERSCRMNPGRFDARGRRTW